MYESLWSLWVTLGLALLYFMKQWLRPARATRLHDQLRQDWLQAVSSQQGTEVLAVQTIRNSLMSCTMTATTATLGLMGGVTLLQAAGLKLSKRATRRYCSGIRWRCWYCWAGVHQRNAGRAAMAPRRFCRRYAHRQPSTSAVAGCGAALYSPGRALLRAVRAAVDVVRAGIAGRHLVLGRRAGRTGVANGACAGH